MPLSKPTGIALASLGLFGLVLVGAVSFFVLQKTAPTDGATVAVASTPVSRDPLTGEVVGEIPGGLPQVYAVMVENSYDAWPLSGLDQAFLVIEAPVEGGIPRFESFFREGVEVAKIGPVRSARPYYLDWAQEFDAIYAHVGGSPEALSLITKNDLLDLNEFFHGNDFWRSTDRFAPHNTYTSSDLLSAARDGVLAAHEAEAPKYEQWLFKADAPSTQSSDFSVDFAAGSVYDVQWKYQAETNSYLRFENGKSQAMTSVPILANNVIVMATDVESIDEKDRKSLRTLGEGEALVAQDGNILQAMWKKTSPTDRLRFYTGEGVEIEMNVGKTWIEVVDEMADVTSSAQE